MQQHVWVISFGEGYRFRGFKASCSTLPEKRNVIKLKTCTTKLKKGKKILLRLDEVINPKFKSPFAFATNLFVNVDTFRVSTVTSST